MNKETILGKLSQDTFKTLSLIFIAVFTLLLFFNPFYLRLFPIKPRLILIVGYSIISCIAFAISFSIFTPFNKKKWTQFLDIGLFLTSLLFTWLLVYAYSIFCIKYLFVKMYHIKEKNYFPDQLFLYSLFCTIVTGSIIFIILRAYHLLISQEKISTIYIQPIKKLGSKNNFINKNEFFITGKNRNESLKLNVHQFIYAKSEGHYIKISYFKKNTKNIKFYTLRNTISTVESQLSDYDSLFRCHKSYIINISFLKSVIGTSNKAHIRLFHHPLNMPIAKINYDYLKSFISSKKQSFEI